MKLDTRFKVLIIGVNGFTGRHLEIFLQNKNYEVYGSSSKDKKIKNHFKVDITKYNEVESLIKQLKPDFIIHLAGISFVAEEDASLIYNVNILGVENVLKSLIKNSINPKKIILSSSAIVYGNQNSSVLSEDMIPSPINHYGISKLAMEFVAKSYFDKLNIIITRPFNYTGRWQNENFLIPKIVKHYKENKKTIEVGNLDVKREFNDIRDIINIYEKLLLTDKKSKIVNIASSNAISILKIIQIMNTLAKYEIQVKINPAFIRENEIKTLCGSIDKLSSIIDVKFNYSIEETLKEMFYE